ncbi:MAG: Asp-tRNA(Asn)/Glu-tRNA(Gln) amidotransferase subunit GatB [Anaerolineae bacterium]|nr:Asp-tRNA(Asn)/Glu-tRNA(Gln) amidotransferase subunit GatB [Anaerolineae bacterium]
MTEYEGVIGLEVHAELLTESKMFCGCRVVDSVEEDPNRAVCPVCLGMPGMLPVLNRRAVEYAMRVALALNCTIHPHNIFARKNYFYPDLPKAYQISQYELPLATGGWLEIEPELGVVRRIGVRRVHMEEDTGKLTHTENGGSLVDYNRSGVPLLEIVSEPDLHSAEEAYVYATKLRQILRYLDVNSGDLEKGVLRVEPNISIRPKGTDQLNTRTEVKNLNSFRILFLATEYELERQANVLDNGGEIVQETRGWNEADKRTFSQRIKEDAHDYRYFPEPDLPPLHIDDAWIERVRAELPELPDAKIARYRNDWGLSRYDAELLADEKVTAEWFEAAVAAGGEPKAIANLLLNNLFKLMNESGQSLDEIDVSPEGLVALTELVEQQTINSNIAKTVLVEMFETGDSAETIVRAKGLAQVSDSDAILAAVQAAIDQNPAQVQQYLDGKDKLMGFFVGQVMRAMKGKANPGVVNQLVEQELDARKE